jgi:acyl-CoA synthetase (AMP-forming)/AMP-acid ligase II
MVIISESEIRGDLCLLSRLWEAEETFILQPDKVGVNQEWIDRSVASIPAEFLSGHFVLLTSGTTGLPKLVVGCRKRAAALTRELHLRQDSEEVSQTISVLPLAYSYSFVNQWLWSHIHDREFVSTAGFGDPRSVSRALAEADNAMICLVGVQVPLLLEQNAGSSFAGVTRIHFAGGRFPQERLPELAALFPEAQVFNNYGCAEAMPRLTVRPAEDASEGANVGRPLSGIELSIDQNGAIKFRSAYGAVGVLEGNIFRRIESQEWVPSGDLGRIEPDGSLFLLGRNSEVFKRHGEKVSLASLSTTVSKVWPGQFAFYRETDASGEEGCVLVLSPLTAVEGIRPVLLALRKHHPRSHWPLRIESLAELPLLTNGKPDVRSLHSMNSKREVWRQHI